jgi:ABC-2 type transport system permease protein
MIIVFPVIVLLVLPFAANFEIKNINLSILDNSHSTYSLRLINKVVSSGYFRTTNISDNYSDALKSVELDKSDIILEIPAGFEKEIINDKITKVMISANTVNGTKGGLGSAYLSGIIYDFSNEIKNKIAVTGKRPDLNFEIVTQYRHNPNLKYSNFMVPALMVMMLGIICGFLPALNIVNEKENGTIEQMNVTPVKKFQFILSKLIPYWVIGFIVLNNTFLIAWLVYDLTPAGSLLTIYTIASVFVLSYSGFGLVISNYAKTIQQAMFMMFFFQITFILISGLYTPINSMPQWAQFISQFSPLKYLIISMRSVYLKGSNLSQLLTPFISLIGFAVFFNTWAVISYRKKGN